jgi:Spermidine/putrescine-binding periplasmic protein
MRDRNRSSIGVIGAVAAMPVALFRARRRAHGQFLQLVELHGAGGAGGFYQGNRHQGGLRHLRRQRDAGDAAFGGKSGYDVVVPTGYFLQRQITAKVFLKLDKSKLPNLANAWPVVTKQLATYDPGNNYAANYMWGTTGIGYNIKTAQKILGPTPKSTAGISSSSRRTSQNSGSAASTCWIPPTISSPLP